ncbi:MAG: cell division protein FtsX [Patescibacteria group bacterium]
MMKHFKVAWQHIRRSPYQALSAVLVMTLTFTIAAIFILLAAGSQAILNWFETRPQVTAFFREGTKIEQVEALKARLEASAKVSQMKYVSKEEALAIYREQNKEDPLLLEMVTANILPASLEVSAIKLSDLGEVAQILKNEPQVEEVIFQEDVISSLSAWTSALRRIGAGLTITLGIISLLVILVIIGMKIALRKEEIEILKLIGATSWYIRAPFILEGVFYGVVGGTFAWIITYILLLYTTPLLVSFLSGIPILPVDPLFMLVLLSALVFGGAAIGTLGSLLATRRYLK